ncbi:D-isomer specific 2-hydroxyacid dehydrogenase [Tricladium varicosporioides]|nr:D-isomer specific 2-hydroxyacid dehydrogenase [Hymenoscyphus varicosporioides]
MIHKEMFLSVLRTSEVLFVFPKASPKSLCHFPKHIKTRTRSYHSSRPQSTNTKPVATGIRKMGSIQKPKVLLIGSITHAKEEWDALKDVADPIVVKSTNRSDFLAEAKSGAFDGVVTAFRSFTSMSITGQFDSEILSSIPTLRFLCQNGAGYDPINISDCTSAGVQVCNVPIIADDATSDTAIFLMLGALRMFNPCMATLRTGEFKGPAFKLGHDPRGKVLGILGMGGIGREVARKAGVFGMKVQYYNRKKLSEEMSGGATYVGFDELLGTSDVLSLNLPLNANTRHIISTAEFAKMKQDVVIVNTARGPVMDEAALVESLESGKVRSAGLDVYEEEPKIHPGLIKNPNVILLPHVGTLTYETQKAMEVFTIENVRRAVEEGRLNGLVPEQAHLAKS